MSSAEMGEAGSKKIASVTLHQSDLTKILIPSLKCSMAVAALCCGVLLCSRETETGQN